MFSYISCSWFSFSFWKLYTTSLLITHCHYHPSVTRFTNWSIGSSIKIHWFKKKVMPQVATHWFTNSLSHWFFDYLWFISSWRFVVVRTILSGHEDSCRSTETNVSTLHCSVDFKNYRVGRWFLQVFIFFETSAHGRELSGIILFNLPILLNPNHFIALIILHSHTFPIDFHDHKP